MSSEIPIYPKEAIALYEKLKREGEAVGYYLNPELDFVMALMEGLGVNKERYGYLACPCRLASGEREKDKDLICPCDYRDADLIDYDACYCGLYVSKKAQEGDVKIKSLPDRRLDGINSFVKPDATGIKTEGLAYPVWRCTVCGYLCARDNPPHICPICKVDKDRFEKFM